MTAPTGTARAQAYADDEHRRAARTGEIAQRHERRTLAEPVMREFHLRMATIHRQVQRQHLAAAARHAARVRPPTPLRLRPTSTSRAHSLLVALVDTLDSDFERGRFLSNFISECVALLDVTAAALLLTDSHDALRAAVCSSEPVRLFTAAEIANAEGPSLRCHRAGAYSIHPTLSALAEWWPRLAAVAGEAGIAAVHAVPLRRRDNALGVLTLFADRPGQLHDDVLSLAGLLAEAVTIGLVNRRTVHQHERTSVELQTALTSRIAIEQAKGILAERLGIPIEAAFALLRGHARARGRRLHEVADEIVERRLDLVVPSQASGVGHGQPA